MSDEQAPEIQINVKGPSELKLQITIATDKTVRELKEAIAAQTDVEADRQRLIYSGRVLKDDDALSVYKIQSTHTIHMVKGAARSGGSSGAASGPAPQQLPTMQTGQNVHDPLTQLNGHMGFGAMAGLNPFGELGLNPNDPNMMQGMMNSPAFLQQMSSMMSNPAVIDQIIASNPQLAAMGPHVRQVFQDEGFRSMLSNPESLQQMLQMASLMQNAGLGGGAGSPMGMFGNPAPSFPAPGTPNTAASASNTTPATNTQSTPTPGSGTTPSAPAAGAPPANPFAALFGGAPGAGAGGSPFAYNPALMQQMLGLGGPLGGGPGAGGLGSYGAAATPAAPADTRSPEERFQVQLQQLQDMGFTNAQQNVRALLATGGNVQSAIDYIFSGGGL